MYGLTYQLYGTLEIHLRFGQGEVIIYFKISKLTATKIIVVVSHICKCSFPSNCTSKSLFSINIILSLQYFAGIESSCSGVKTWQIVQQSKVFFLLCNAKLSELLYYRQKKKKKKIWFV